MVNKFLTKTFILLMLIILVFYIVYPISNVRQDANLGDKSKVIIEVIMTKVDDSDEYILEYSNGRSELLKSDGSRVPLAPIYKKD